MLLFQLVDHLVKERHFEMRMRGYLNFYNNTHIHHRMLFYLVSLWNAALLFIQTLMQHFYPNDFAEKCIENHALTPINYVCAFFTFEFCLVAGININYICKYFLVFMRNI